MSVVARTLQHSTERQANMYHSWDWLRILGSADCGSGHHEDRPAHHGSGGQEDIYTTDNSSSSEGFLDPHERSQDFLTKGLLSSPMRPHCAKLQSPPARAPVKVRGPYESVSQGGGENTATRNTTDNAKVPHPSLPLLAPNNTK